MRGIHQWPVNSLRKGPVMQKMFPFDDVVINHSFADANWSVDDDVMAWKYFYWHGLTLIPAWISNYIHYNVWDEITYQFLNFNGCTVEV